MRQFACIFAVGFFCILARNFHLTAAAESDLLPDTTAAAAAAGESAPPASQAATNLLTLENDANVAAAADSLSMLTESKESSPRQTRQILSAYPYGGGFYKPFFGGFYPSYSYYYPRYSYYGGYGGYGYPYYGYGFYPRYYYG